jgi:hypothetical protein
MVPNDQNPNPIVSIQSGKLAQLIPYVVYGTIAVAFLVVIGWGLAGKEGFLASLADREIARGLITFLIAITTVGIAVILTFSTIFGEQGDAEDKRFDRGKQVLTTFIGVLGTIVGFYFGSEKISQPTTAVAQQQTLALAPARLSNAQPKKGEKITISSFVLGGKPPYTYSITFDSTLSAIKDKPSPDGAIKEELTIPETFNADKEVGYQISVKDSEGKTADYNKDGGQKISVKAK